MTCLVTLFGLNLFTWFDEFLENCSLRTNSVTRQVKCQLDKKWLKTPSKVFENQWKCLILSPFIFLARNREEAMNTKWGRKCSPWHLRIIDLHHELLCRKLYGNSSPDPQFLLHFFSPLLFRRLSRHPKIF